MHSLARTFSVIAVTGSRQIDARVLLAMADARGRPIIKQEGWKGSSSYQIQGMFADEPIQALSALLQPIVGAL